MDQLTIVELSHVTVTLVPAEIPRDPHASLFRTSRPHSHLPLLGLLLESVRANGRVRGDRQRHLDFRRRD
jgi:hypothetical protein